MTTLGLSALRRSAERASRGQRYAHPACMRLLLLALVLASCAPTVIDTGPATGTLPPPVTVILPPPVVILPATLPVTVLDEKAVSVTLTDGVLRVALADGVTGIWVRLTLPGGQESAVTDNGACHCLGLGGASAHEIAVVFIPGLTVSTSASLDGPWTVAATTR